MRTLKLCDYIVKQCAKMGENTYFKGITNLKLQKILYFLQAYFLVFMSKELINEKFEKWPYGPVVPIAYEKYKCYGKKPIPIPKNDIVILDLTNIEMLQINCLLYELNKFSAAKLALFSHSKPWEETKELKEINNKQIKDFYEIIKDNFFSKLTINSYHILDLDCFFSE